MDEGFISGRDSRRTLNWELVYDLAVLFWNKRGGIL